MGSNSVFDAHCRVVFGSGARLAGSPGGCYYNVAVVFGVFLLLFWAVEEFDVVLVSVGYVLLARDELLCVS